MHTLYTCNDKPTNVIDVAFYRYAGELDNLYQPVYSLNNKIFKGGQNTDIGATETWKWMLLTRLLCHIYSFLLCCT